MKITTYEELINEIKSKSSDEAKINFLMNWMLKNVEYDYVYLEKAKGFTNGHFTEIDNKFDCSDEVERQKAIEYAKKHFGYSDKFIAMVLENYGQQEIVPAKPERVAFGKVWPAEPERVIYKNFANSVLGYDGKVFTNGLITKGVCTDFAKFIFKVLSEVNVNCEIIEGKTSVGHVWNIINGGHYDITYAMFVRDCYNDWHEKSKIEDWFNITEEKLLKLQPNRTIDKSNENIYKNN